MTTGWERKRSSAGKREGEKKKKNIENERRDKSCWHNVSTIRFAGRRTAFYFCFAPIIDEPCRCFCLTNGRCLCDLALFALHPFTSLRIALRSQCLFSSLSLFFSPSPLYIFFVFLVIFTTDALIKETSKPKPFTPGNALSFLFRPPLRQFSSLTAASFSSRLTFDGRQIGSVLIIQRCPPRHFEIESRGPIEIPIRSREDIYSTSIYTHLQVAA